MHLYVDGYRPEQTRHVLTGQINPHPNPQQQPLSHGQQLCEVSSPSTLSEKGNNPETFLQCLNCDRDLGNITPSQVHDTNGEISC